MKNKIIVTSFLILCCFFSLFSFTIKAKKINKNTAKTNITGNLLFKGDVTGTSVGVIEITYIKEGSENTKTVTITDEDDFSTQIEVEPGVYGVMKIEFKGCSDSDPYLPKGVSYEVFEGQTTTVPFSIEYENKNEDYNNKSVNGGKSGKKVSAEQALIEDAEIAAEEIQKEQKETITPTPQVETKKEIVEKQENSIISFLKNNLFVLILLVVLIVAYFIVKRRSFK